MSEMSDRRVEFCSFLLSGICSPDTQIFSVRQNDVKKIKKEKNEKDKRGRAEV